MNIIIPSVGVVVVAVVTCVSVNILYNYTITT